MMIKKFLKNRWRQARGYLPLTLLTLLMSALAMPVFAAYDYYIPIRVYNNSATAYTNLPVLVSLNNTGLYNGGYILSTGLDTDVQEGTSIPYSVSSARLGIYTASLTGYQTRDYTDYLGYDPAATDYPLITGVGGNVTIADAAALEGGADFQVDFSGYIDTSASNVNENVVYKDDSFRLYVNSAGNIAAEIATVGPFRPVAMADCSPATGAWNDVDANTYGVPAGATGVILMLEQSGTTAYDIGVRKNGSTDDRVQEISIAQTAHTWAMTGIDTDGLFEVWLENAAMNVYITGYTMPDIVFFTNGTDKSMGGLAAWTDIDCSAQVPVGVSGLIFEIVNTSGTAYEYGLRNNGSATDIHTGIDGTATSHNWAVVGCDTGRVCEGYIENAAVDFYLIGYIAGGAVFPLDKVDISLGGTGAYAGIDLTANSSTLSDFAFVEVASSVSAAYDYHVRKNGAADDYYESLVYLHAWAFVAMDAGQIIEGKISNANVNFYLVGYGMPVLDGTTDVATAACASGVHDIRVIYDGANIELYIDDMGVAADTEAYVGSVPDNGNTWEFLDGDVCPYTDSFKYEVGGVQQIWYQPVTIIGTTAVDRSGTGHHGTINWGANPAGIEITISGIVSSTAYTATGNETAIPDILPIPTGFNITSTNTTGIAGMWLYDLVNRSANSLGFSAQTMYVLIGLIASTGVGFGALIGTGNMLAFSIGFGATAGLFASAGVMPWWVIIISISVVAMGIYSWRRG